MTSASWVASHVRYGSCFVPSSVIGMAPSVRRIARTQSSASRPLVSGGSAGFASAALQPVGKITQRRKRLRFVGQHPRGLALDRQRRGRLA